MLADDLLEIIVEEDPLHDAIADHPHAAGRLADLSEEGQAALRKRADAIVSAVSADDAGGDPVDRAVLRQQAEAVIARLDARLVEYTMAGFDHSALGRVLGALPQLVPAPGEEERVLDRLAAVPAFLAAAAQRHRGGLASGRTPVAARARHAVERIDAYLAAPADDPFAAVPLRSPELAARRDRILTTAVRPAFIRYRDLLADELVPAGRPAERPGLCWLPDGVDTYTALARTHTTTAHTPAQLHETGLELLEALDRDYVGIGAAVTGASTAEGVRARLRADPALRWRDAGEMLAAARRAVERATTVAPTWFRRFPRSACAIEPAMDPFAPPGYYVPETYFVNVTNPGERGRYAAEATAFHEAVPGHHVQLALARELTDLPPLRRYAWINAYVEGWGLYAERLADEMGLYTDATARLGMLAMDSLRAARLVVDTGLHARGWSRARAVDFLTANTLLGPVEAAVEADRYIEYPGQALSYMVGRMELQRLRDHARATLGARFDIRDFHDLVLTGGALPMTVLDDVVTAWLAGAA
jgi:uncharacterized protein (DUF885 family)